MKIYVLARFCEGIDRLSSQKKFAVQLLVLFFAFYNRNLFKFLKELSNLDGVIIIKLKHGFNNKRMKF